MMFGFASGACGDKYRLEVTTLAGIWLGSRERAVRYYVIYLLVCNGTRWISWSYNERKTYLCFAVFGQHLHCGRGMIIIANVTL